VPPRGHTDAASPAGSRPPRAGRRHSVQFWEEGGREEAKEEEEGEEEEEEEREEEGADARFHNVWASRRAN